MTFNEADVNRKEDGKFGEKVGAKPEVSLIATRHENMKNWLDVLDPEKLSYSDSSKLGELQYEIEKIRVRQAGYSALRELQEEDPTITGLAVYGSEDAWGGGFSTSLYGVYRGKELTTTPFEDGDADLSDEEYEKAQKLGDIFSNQYEQVAASSDALDAAYNSTDEETGEGTPVYEIS